MLAQMDDDLNQVEPLKGDDGEWEMPYIMYPPQNVMDEFEDTGIAAIFREIKLKSN